MHEGYIVAILTAVGALGLALYPVVSKLWKQKHEQSREVKKDTIGEYKILLSRQGRRLDRVEERCDELAEKVLRQGAHIQYLEGVLRSGGTEFQPWVDPSDPPSGGEVKAVTP